MDHLTFVGGRNVKARHVQDITVGMRVWIDGQGTGHVRGVRLSDKPNFVELAVRFEADGREETIEVSYGDLVPLA